MNNKEYREVKMDIGGYDRTYKNPLTKTYQLEYALFLSICSLFKEVKSDSYALDSLKLYFSELPINNNEAEGRGGKPKVTRGKLMAVTDKLVRDDLVGHVTFPMINECIAFAKVTTNDDKTHTFTFGDGIYTFGVRLVNKKREPLSIEVKDLTLLKAHKDTDKKEGKETTHRLTGAA